MKSFYVMTASYFIGVEFMKALPEDEIHVTSISYTLGMSNIIFLVSANPITKSLKSIYH